MKTVGYTRKQLFDNAVNSVVKNPPKYGLGYKHYLNGLNPNYNGPKYGYSTIADSFYQAGVKARKA